MMFGVNVCVVKLEGIFYFCKIDEVGEICVNFSVIGIVYYGLFGIMKNVFEVVLVIVGGVFVFDRLFIRIGLLGFIGFDNLVFIVGKLDGLMVIGVCRYNVDDVVVIVLVVEFMKFVYRGRIVVFFVIVLYDDWIVLVVE